MARRPPTSAPPQDVPFRPGLFHFLAELERHNRRDWFGAHREEYETLARRPALAFVAACAPRLRRVDPGLVADPRPAGGSLLRPNRDLRFTPDRPPYWTSVVVRFAHERGPGAPELRLRLAPEGCACELGLRRPDGEAREAVRAAIVRDPRAWHRARAALGDRFRFEGELLARVPRGLDPDHPCAEDLRRRTWFAAAPLARRVVTARSFPGDFVELARLGRPLLRFLLAALEDP